MLQLGTITLVGSGEIPFSDLTRRDSRTNSPQSEQFEGTKLFLPTLVGGGSTMHLPALVLAIWRSPSPTTLLRVLSFVTFMLARHSIFIAIVAES